MYSFPETEPYGILLNVPHNHLITTIEHLTCFSPWIIFTVFIILIDYYFILSAEGCYEGQIQHTTFWLHIVREAGGETAIAQAGYKDQVLFTALAAVLCSLDGPDTLGKQFWQHIFACQECQEELIKGPINLSYVPEGHSGL